MGMHRGAAESGADATADVTADVTSDAGLVRALIEGSQGALAMLYDRHASTIFAAAMRVSHDRSIAADVVQETFLTLWDRAERFDPTRGSLSSWLSKIARNRTIDQLRTANRRHRAVTFTSLSSAAADDHEFTEWLTRTGELVAAAEPEPVPEDALSNSETRASVDTAVASLGPLERRVIMLAYGGGLSQSEIAAQLGWPLGTVKTRTRRALHQLRESLDRTSSTGSVLGDAIGAANSQPCPC
jgi:RNA polymerase sigma-70 factor (ECF subfamily)